ncbi:hypothetical protein [Aquimarina litoralis]|uniref:hypothetical protein n=1 Tax=Aquimarina litoralis TaxID=584605 RepID=UPI001C59DE19|nr:hypothetical protein [Aquimarina litoralis]MBW1296995.1 hypothetical protein [Aquimarina litoralis]
MKKYVVLLVIPFLMLSACSNDDDNGIENPDLLGKWRLIEQLVDPGDGSGTFQTVSSNQELEFLAEGVLQVSNGSLCSLSVDTEGNSTESYSLDEGKITADCNNFIGISFEIKEGRLFLYFSCIEGCAQKYQKI